MCPECNERRRPRKFHARDQVTKRRFENQEGDLKREGKEEGVRKKKRKGKEGKNGGKTEG